ncbi:MAG: sensor histidine kinase, partial [Waterburya sp.]
LPSTLENLWIIVWIIVPSSLLITTMNLNTNFYNYKFKYILINLFSLIGIILTGYLFLNFGYWIPVANPIIALLFSLILGYNYIELIKEKQSVLFLEKQLDLKTQELEKTQQELIAKEKLQAYEKLSVNMAHEIRNYLNAINLASNNGQSKLEDLAKVLKDNAFLFEGIYESDNQSPIQTFNYFKNKFNKIENNVKTISLIIESILAENTPNTKPSLININQLIEQIVRESDCWMKIRVKETLNLSFQLDLASDLPQIKIDSIELQRVLINLLANACDSLYQKTLNDSEYSSIITLTTSHTYSVVEIKVRDNGIGISQDNLNQIFAPFWTTKSSVDGIGVGLFFSQQKIEKYNGTITVESQVGEWAEFKITLNVTNE